VCYLLLICQLYYKLVLILTTGSDCPCLHDGGIVYDHRDSENVVNVVDDAAVVISGEQH
jgi:hypothetical protein